MTRPRQRAPRKLTPRISGECGGPFTVEAWRYVHPKYQEVCMSIKDSTGQWLQVSLLVPSAR